MLISLLKRCSVTPSVSSLKATVSTGWTLMKPRWWVTETTRQTFYTSLCLSLHSAFLTYSQWIVHFAEKRCSRISADLQWRYTSRYYQQAVGELLIRRSRCFPSPADLQCVVPTVHRVQPAAVLPALPSPLLPSAASPLRRQPNRLSGTFLSQLHVILLASLLKSWRLSAHLCSRFPHELQGVAGYKESFAICVCWQEEEEFSSLAMCLGLLPSAPQPSSMVHSASCLQWAVNAFDLVTQWCTEVTVLSQMQTEQSVVCRQTQNLLHWFNIKLTFFPPLFFLMMAIVFRNQFAIVPHVDKTFKSL